MTKITAIEAQARVDMAAYGSIFTDKEICVIKGGKSSPDAALKIVRELAHEVSSMTGVSVDDILSGARGKENTYARHVVMWKARKMKCTIKCIADIFGCTGGAVHKASVKIQTLMDKER